VRVLMLAQFYAPIVGGEEQLVRTLSTELVERGHDVAVAPSGAPAWRTSSWIVACGCIGSAARLNVCRVLSAKPNPPLATVSRSGARGPAQPGRASERRKSSTVTTGWYVVLPLKPRMERGWR